MPFIVTIHLYVGLLVVLAAVGLIWKYPGRRITLYLLTVQILLGAAVMSQGLRAPAIHWLLALLAWILFMAANAVTKRAEPTSKLPIGIAVAASLMVLVTYGIGQHALRHAG